MSLTLLRRLVLACVVCQRACCSLGIRQYSTAFDVAISFLTTAVVDNSNDADVLVFKGCDEAFLLPEQLCGDLVDRLVDLGCVGSSWLVAQHAAVCAGALLNSA